MTDLTNMLADIRGRAEAATEGPWMHVQAGTGIRSGGGYNFVTPAGGRGCIVERGVTGTPADTEFIASARTDVPRLLAALEGVLATTYASDDGTEWEHNDGCEGEPTCPACWAKDTRAAVVAALGEGK